MSRPHLFVMDPIEDLNLPLDTSLRLAAQLSRRGVTCYFATLADIFWHSSSESAAVQCRRLDFSSVEPPRLSMPPESEERLLTTFAMIHMRKDPPFNLSYVAATWYLDSAKNRAVVLNDPAALRGNNEKLALFRFPRYALKTLVSSNVSQLLEFFEHETKGDAVLKPLTLHGGQGILRLQSKTTDRADITRLLQMETDGGRVARLIQPFNPQVLQGEVRAFCVMGRPLAWCLKKPQAGQFLANSAFGATRHAYKPDRAEEAMVGEVARVLTKDGIHVVGFDLIGGLISEINITSPRLLVPENENPEPYYVEFAERIMGTL